MQEAPRTLLVPVDFSDATDCVLATARTFAAAFKSRVVLLHIVEPEPDFATFEPGPVSVRNAVAKEFHATHKQLEQAKHDLVGTGLDVTALQIQGETVRQILNQCAHHQAGMIIIGSHGHGALYHLLTGSVAAGVLKSAQCPVLVVPVRKHG